MLTGAGALAWSRELFQQLELHRHLLLELHLGAVLHRLVVEHDLVMQPRVGVIRTLQEHADEVACPPGSEVRQSETKYTVCLSTPLLFRV